MLNMTRQSITCCWLFHIFFPAESTCNHEIPLITILLFFFYNCHPSKNSRQIFRSKKSRRIILMINESVKVIIFTDKYYYPKLFT